MKKYSIFPRAPLTGALLSDGLILYPGHSLEVGVLSYLSQVFECEHNSETRV